MFTSHKWNGAGMEWVKEWNGNGMGKEWSFHSLVHLFKYLEFRMEWNEISQKKILNYLMISILSSFLKYSLIFNLIIMEVIFNLITVKPNC